MILFIYLIKLVACTALFYGYYCFFLQNKQLHQFNRFYLLFSLALAMIFPLFKLPLFNIANGLTSSQTFNGLAFGGWEKNIILTPGNSSFHSIMTAQNMLLAIYVTGLSIALYPMIKSFAYIRSLVRKHESKLVERVQFYETLEPGTPFSFINTVFWNSRISLESDEGQQILKHELFHVRQKHSYDILFMQFVNALLWFNPICYLVNKELKVIHEFLADEYAAGTNKFRYAETMVMQAVSPKQIFLSNQFFYNQIKRRITMILQSNKTNYSNARKAMVLPVILVMFIACSVKNKDEGMTKTVAANNVVTIKDVELETIEIKPEVEASYPGGAEPWMKYLNKTFVYPKEAIKKNIQGTVIVEFVVTKTGSIEGIKAISGDNMLKEEAIRMIASSGNWTPASWKGQPVASYRRQPITFVLQEN